MTLVPDKQPHPIVPDESGAESLRRTYLRHESDVRSVGQLCYLVAVISSLGTLEFALFANGNLPRPPELKAFASPELVSLCLWCLTLVLLLNTLAQVGLGYGLTHLQPWARWVVVGLTGLSLTSSLGLGVAAVLAYPIYGTIGLILVGAIHALILYPLLTPRSEMVFSRPYRAVIRQTPTIKGRMHWMLKALIGLIMAGVAGLVGYLAAIYFRLID